MLRSFNLFISQNTNLDKVYFVIYINAIFLRWHMDFVHIRVVQIHEVSRISVLGPVRSCFELEKRIRNEKTQDKFFGNH